MATNNSNFDILIKRRLDAAGANPGAPGSIKSGELAMNEVGSTKSTVISSGDAETLYYGVSTASGTISAVPIGGRGAFLALDTTAQSISGTKTFSALKAYNSSDVETLANEDVITKAALVSKISSFSSGGAGSVTLGSPLTSDITVGSIDEGEALPGSTTLYQFVTALLYKEYQPTKSDPSATLSKTNPTVDVEYGSIVTVDLDAGFIRGSIYGTSTNGVWNENAVQGNRAGAATKYEFQVGSDAFVDNGTDDTYTFESQSFDSPKSYRVKVSYGEGDQPLTSKGNNSSTLTKLAPGTDTSADITITPKAPIFYSRSSSDIAAASDANLRALTKTLAKAIDSTADYTFNLNFSVGDKYAVVAFPKSWGALASVKLSNGQGVTDSFDALSDVELTLATGGTETYAVYKWTGDGPMLNPNVWTVTLP